MTSNKYICNGCGFTYEETPGDLRAGMPPKTPFEVLSDDWRCPNCNASKNMFHASGPVSFSFDQGTGSQEDIIAQLQVIAEHGRKSFAESKSIVVPVDYLGEGIHELAIKATGKPAIAERRTLSVFFGEGAIKLLRQTAVNYYWFWKMVLQAAIKAERLPITSEQVQVAIDDLRASFSRHLDLNKSLDDLDQEELARRVVYGLVVLKLDSDHHYSLHVNPLFQVSDDKRPAPTLASLREAKWT